MEKKEKIIKNDSAYEKSLKRLLKLSRNYCDELNDKIDNEKKAIKEIENSFTAGEVAIYLFSVTILIEVLGTILIGVLPQAQELLTYLDTHPKIFPLITVPTAIIIPIVSLPIASIIDAKNKKKCTEQISILTKQREAINVIYKYLKSELIIAKEHDQLLSNNQILEKEKIHDTNMNYILKNTDIDTDINVKLHVQNLKNKYLEEYQKNKIIMDSLKNLDNNEKKEYLRRIYQQTNMDFTKTNIDINELKLPNENNITLELPNNISDNYLSLYPSENVGLFEGAIYSDNQVENAPQLKKRYPN